MSHNLWLILKSMYRKIVWELYFKPLSAKKEEFVQFCMMIKTDMVNANFKAKTKNNSPRSLPNQESFQTDLSWMTLWVNQLSISRAPVNHRAISKYQFEISFQRSPFSLGRLLEETTSRGTDGCINQDWQFDFVCPVLIDRFRQAQREYIATKYFMAHRL